MSIHLNNAAGTQLRGGRSSIPTIASALLVVVVAAASCGSDDGAVSELEVTSPVSVDTSTSTTAKAGSAPATDTLVGSVVDDSIIGAEEGSITVLPTTTSTTTSATQPTPMDTDPVGPETASGVSLSIECTRGNSLNDLGIDLTRVPFVDDNAPDDTTWIDIVMRIANPTDERVAVDPGFGVSFLDNNGEELAGQPWVDGSDPVYRGLEAMALVIGPDQTFTRRVVVFDEFSGTRFLRNNQARLLESLESCVLSGEPDIATVEPYELPVGVSLEIGPCAPTEDGSVFEATLAAENTGETAAQLSIAAELIDDSGDRIAVIGSNERPVSIEPGATETRTLQGAAWPTDDLTRVASCRIYAAEVPSSQS